jgi:hypothetical protein
MDRNLYILTKKKGYIQLYNTNINDYILNSKNIFLKINYKSKIKYDGFIYIICTNLNCENYKFYDKINLYIWKNNNKWININDLTINDYIGLPINTNNIIPKINNIILNKNKYWYCFGFFINNCWYNNQNNKWFYIFKLFGLINKHIPEWVHDAPIEFIKEFLKGFNNNLLNSNINYELALDIQRLYLKINEIVSIRKINNKSYYLKRYIKNDKGFIFNKYAWFKIHDIKKKEVENLILYKIDNYSDFIINNILIKL